MRYRLLFLALAALIGGSLLVPPAQASAQAAPRRDQSLDAFLSQTVIPKLDDFWKNTARENNIPYTTPEIRMFRSGERVESACTSSIAGHAYCPMNQTIFLDVSSRYNASFGRLWRQDRDWAIMLIVAHEWGHHMQRMLNLRGNGSIRQSELQADCMAGLFARYAKEKGFMNTTDDMDEAMQISFESGDSTHGSGREREDAFMKGFDEYTGAACGIRR